MPRALLLVENASVPRDPRVWPECLTLRGHGWDVTVISPMGTRHDREPLEIRDGVRIIRFATPVNTGGFRQYVSEYSVAIAKIHRRIRWLSSTERFDIVHAANPPDMLLLAALALRHRGSGFVFDQHDLSPELFEAKFERRGPVYWALRGIELAAFRLADVVISPNESFRRIAMDRGGIKSENVFVVRNGPDPAVFKPVAPDPVLRGKARFVLGYVGLMGTQDGVLQAIEALALLRRRRSDWHMIFVGDGEIVPAARALAARRGLTDSVSFLGFIDDKVRVVQCIASCDVCLSPEPLNTLNDNSTLIKVAEYMSVGKPVVAFNLRETAATLGPDVPLANTVPDYAELIDELLEEGARREAFGRAGRARILAELSWDHSQRSLLAAYEQALVRARARRESRHD